jgi:hypothetical protein
MIVRLLASPRRARRAASKTITYGGAPMYVADCLRAIELFGPRLYQLFGQGEAPMTITGLPNPSTNSALILIPLELREPAWK